MWPLHSYLRNWQQEKNIQKRFFSWINDSATPTQRSMLKLTPGSLIFGSRGFTDSLFYRGWEECMKSKRAKLTKSATRPGIRSRKNWSFKMYFLYYLLDSQSGLCSHKIHASGLMTVRNYLQIKSIREKGEGRFGFISKIIL